MPDYDDLKTVHRLMVVLSISGFSLRGLLMLAGSGLLRRRWMRTWPHLIDTVLLVSGIWLAVTLHLDPLQHPWLAAKLLALLLYIALGFVALRLGRTRRARSLALALALACFGYMVAVALTKSPLPGLALADVVEADGDLRHLGLHQPVALDREVA